MHVALIGMSGTGKSYWSDCLAATGFTRIGCDDLIGRRLAAALDLPGESLAAIGRWMGFPHQTGFHQRQALYLELERQVLNEILDRLEAPPQPGNGDVVVDTTGSVVYAGPSIQQRLREAARVVYLTLNAAQQRRAREAYLARPRPVVWQGFYRKRSGESHTATLRRCYAALLRDRHRRYREWAHLEIPAPDAACGPVSRQAFLTGIAAQDRHDP